ncbi:LOW QUALITY PROTEIN: solute carrier family 41 member 1-like [Rhipicephalus sanguineus]|uniref:LOW QUALITY PROTEIN: solute carrier family 41 member 1-like n=1 Tax=Rhipicephalus sanguineus TaxID=34632 RepID=UPI0020C58F55|nr:LOW QUALITY PROTEIN: solute carrier family 41 member 1-like [Rhipicephalus sanguineus]
MVPLEEGRQDPGIDVGTSTVPADEVGHVPFMPSPTPSRCPSEVFAPISVDACVGTAIIGCANQLTSTAIQVFVPFILAGFGSTLAGILLDVVKDWPVYVTVHQIFVLIPPLLGLNGNLEQTLVARLSTQANLGNLNRVREQLPMIFANVALLQCQSTVATFLACTLAVLKGLAIDGLWDPSHIAVLYGGALAAVNTASLFLSFVMSTVVVISTKCEKNPDNIAPAIAASFGDLTTLFLLSGYSSFLLYNPYLAPLVVLLCLLPLPMWIVLARRNSVSREVLRVGWLPIVVALTVSSFGGYILDYAVIAYPPIALHLSAVNALGGNLAAVFSCSLSSYLNRLTPLGDIPFGERLCVGPLQMYTRGEMANVAYVLVGVVVPGQTLFAVLSRILRFGKVSMTITFFAAYIGASLAQVLVLLYLARLIVYRLWSWGVDPDNAAIPCLTGCGDFLGTGFLTMAYALLYYMGDKSSIREEELPSHVRVTTHLTAHASTSTIGYNATMA